MTPEELHSRILLHELRTILLDETREGDQLPQEWKQVLREDPHNSVPYLILADFLEEQGSELGELCRIQVELIGLLPVDGGIPDIRQMHYYHRHPFDFVIKSLEEPMRDLLPRRLEIVEPLYPPRECQINQVNLLTRRGAERSKFQEKWLERNGFDTNRPFASDYDQYNRRTVFAQSRKLGRTTRMLTDVLRYCSLNQGMDVAVVHQNPEALAHTDFVPLATELFHEPTILESQPMFSLNNANVVHFLYPDENSAPPDITFTDHACQWSLNTFQTEWQGPARSARDDALIAMRYALENQPIQHNPSFFINPDNI